MADNGTTWSVRATSVQQLYLGRKHVERAGTHRTDDRHAGTAFQNPTVVQIVFSEKNETSGGHEPGELHFAGATLESATLQPDSKRLIKTVFDA